MAIHAVFALSKDDPEARSWLVFLRQHGCTSLSNLVIERVFWLEGDFDLYRLMPPATAKTMRDKKKWTWWRLSIGADGTWISFRKSE